MQLKMARLPDYDSLMRAVLLIALTVFLVRLIITGDITGYIHPRFTWFTASAGIGFVLMAAGQLARGLQGVTGMLPRFRSRLYLAFTLVLCLGFLTRPYSFGADLANKQGLNVTNRSSSRAGAAPPAGVESRSGDIAATHQTGEPATPPAQSAPPAQAAPGGNTTPPVAEPPSTMTLPAPPAPSRSEPEGDTIVITPRNFFLWMTDLYDTPAQFAGKRLSMEGFSFYPPDAEADNFAVVRLIVTCHVAHAFPDGLLSYVPGQSRPVEDTWHRVEGVLEPHVYRGTPTLRLRIDSMTVIPAPPDPYVYP